MHAMILAQILFMAPALLAGGVEEMEVVSVVDDPEPIDSFLSSMKTLDATHSIYVPQVGDQTGWHYAWPPSPLQIFKISRDDHSNITWTDPVPQCWADLEECESDVTQMCRDSGHGDCEDGTAEIVEHENDDEVTCTCECQYDGAQPFIIGDECDETTYWRDECPTPTCPLG
jgi:hypothetical protein